MGWRSSSLVMKVAVCLSVIVAVCSAESWLAGPYTLVKRAAEPQRTRFFTGNNAIDAGAAGAALVWAPSTSPTRYSTRAPGEALGEATRGPTTGSLVDRPCRMERWDFLPDLQERL